MLFFDAHCDILSTIKSPQEFFSNEHHWDFKRALSNGPFIQVLSCFAGTRFRQDPKSRMEEQVNLALEIEREFPDKFEIIRQSDQVEKARAGTKLFGVLEAEGSEILGGSISELDRIFDLGLRVLTLVWNFDNQVCDSVAGKNTYNGLSSFGKKVVRRAQELGILIDVSHASDKTFYDVVEISRKPITASHSNVRALCNHPRNLTDEQIRIVAQMGGVIGINFYPVFLENSGNAQIMDIIKHIEYIAALVGTKSIGLGSDFDGFSGLPSGISGVEDISKVINVLLQLNYPEEAVRDIGGNNFVRLFGQILPS